MTTVVLAHSPVTGPAAWGGLPVALGDRRVHTVVLDVTDDDAPPYAVTYVARAATQLRAARPEDAVLAGHSGAGYLLPPLAAAARAAGRRVRGYVFVDAGLPPVREATRLTLMHAEDPAFAADLEEELRSGARFPTWTSEELRDLVPDQRVRDDLVASLRPRGLDFFTEPLPVTADWPDAPCGYLPHSASYDSAARSARSRGWPVVDRDLGHFAACADPERVADDLVALLDAL
jgi:hypothetical protein